MGLEHADDWQDACQYEMDAMAKNKVWVLVYLPPGRKAVKSRWVFRRKVDLCYRARVVAKGFTQILGLDYDETFSPVAQFESLRLLLVLAALEDWEIHQMDIKLAFLNGLLDEEIYMEQLKGLCRSRSPQQSLLIIESNLWIEASISRLEHSIPWSPSGLGLHAHSI